MGGGGEWEEVGSGRRWGVGGGGECLYIDYQISGRCLRADKDMWDETYLSLHFQSAMDVIPAEELPLNHL